MENSNPYRPPRAPTVAATDTEQGLPVRLAAALIPAALSVAIAMLLWVVFVSTLEGVVGLRFDLLIWASTLFLASSTATVVINHLWRAKTYPLAFGTAFALFSVVFALLEGDTSGGADVFNMGIVYGTLLVLPVAVFSIVQWMNRIRV